MNCPICGRFMGLGTFDDFGRSAGVSVFWWWCGNGCSREPTPAPAYDWLYWYKDIPREDLEAEPELKAEWEQAKQAYLNRNKKR